jgi:hypothetical protein
MSRSVKPITAIMSLAAVLLFLSALSLSVRLANGSSWASRLALLFVSLATLVAGLPLFAVSVMLVVQGSVRRWRIFRVRNADE